MNRKMQFVTVVLGVLVCAPLIAQAQQSGSLTENSYRRAREVLDAGQKALGVWGAKPGFDDVRIKLNGKLYSRNQSVSADRTDTVQLDGEFIVDYAKNRLAIAQKAVFAGGFKLDNRVLFNADKGTVVQEAFHSVGPVPNPQAKEALLSRIPQILLVRAYERANTLRWMGEATFAGKKQNVISFATANGAQTMLYFDAATNVLSKWETLGTDPVSGDAVTEVSYAGWQTVDGVKLPTRQIQKIAGEMAQDIAYEDVRVNSHPADAIFEAPKDYAAAPPAPPTKLEVTEVAKDVWMFGGLGAGAYAPMVVAFNDYVMVIEPMLNEATSRLVLDKIKELAPGKPVRYVAATHHHSDHSGGVRTYFAEGVTLVTTPGNVKHFQQAAAAHFTMPPDALELNHRAPVIETIQNKKRVFTDGTHTIELYDIGPSPHANEMVVAWLPKERVLFTGDLLVRDPFNKIAPAIEATQHLSDAIARLGLPVERIVEVHAGVNTIADLRQAVELARAAGQRAEK